MAKNKQKNNNIPPKLALAYIGAMCLVLSLAILTSITVFGLNTPTDVGTSLFSQTGSDSTQISTFSNEILMALSVLTAVGLFAIFYLIGRMKTIGQKLATANPVVVNKGKATINVNADTLSLATHQMKTPLTAVRWLTEELLENSTGQLNPKQRELVDQIEKSAVRMKDLVDSFLSGGKKQADPHIRVTAQPTNIANLVNKVVGELKTSMNEKEIVLHKNIDMKVPIANIDPKLVHECLSAILSNSIKYSYDKSTVGLNIWEKDHELITEITDHGCGIPKDEQSKVFSKYFRSKNASELDPDGHGLGMYLVKEMAKSFGGKIWFVSEENKGTTVWLSIPLSHHK